MADLALINAQVAGRRCCVRIEAGRIASLDEPARRGDQIIDLAGDRLLPGLINAHDHLQLNSLPRLSYRPHYGNASQWIADIGPRLTTDPLLLANRDIPREQRLLIGGIKNLLSGVTTVAHHDPLYAPLMDGHFPVRLVTRYGWSHSLALDGASKVSAAQLATPAEEPWIIHAAEGIDAAAGAEFAHLRSLGCITRRSVLVHGLALSAAEHRELAAAGASVIWCPSSNLHLFGRTLDVRSLEDRRHVALGSDSRLSGTQDLLCEIALAASLGLEDAELERLVTVRPANVLRLRDRGALRVGLDADLLVLPAGRQLRTLARNEIALVLKRGQPMYGDERYTRTWQQASFSCVCVDGRAKRLARSIALQLASCRISEPGLRLATAEPTPECSSPMQVAL